MKRTFIIAASSLGLLFVGAGLPVANASTTPALANAGTALLASTATAQSKKERREIRQMQKAADRNERLNQQRRSGSSDRASRGGNSGRDRGNARADRHRGSNDRGAHRGRSSSHRNDAHSRGRSYRDHDTHSRHRSSSSYRHSDRHHDRHYDRRHDRRHDHHRSGVHFGISSGGVHFGVHSGSHGHRSYGHRSYSHRSYRHGSHHSHHGRHYRYYQPRTYYRPYYRCTTPVIEREVVVIEREPVVRETVVVRRPTASSVDGLRGWDYLIHGEAARAQSYFSDVCQTYYDAGLPKLGFGFSALAKGDLRNAAHGIRRAFEFDADGVSDGPPVADFDELVAELRAGVEHRIETDARVTGDHWFLSAAMAFYDKDYHNAKYAIDAAKNQGDTSRGCVALAQMIDGKIAYEESMLGR